MGEDLFPVGREWAKWGKSAWVCMCQVVMTWSNFYEEVSKVLVEDRAVDFTNAFDHGCLIQKI